MQEDEIYLPESESRLVHSLTTQQVEEINDLLWQLGIRVYEILSTGRLESEGEF